MPTPNLNRDALASLTDADLDGHPDFAVAVQGTTTVHSGRDGSVIRTLSFSSLPVVKVVAGGDVDRDGATDLWIVDQARARCVAVRTGAVLHDQPAPVWFDAGHDVDADGYDDALFVDGTTSHRWRVLSGRTGAWIIDQNLGYLTSGAVLIGDADGDGGADVAVTDVLPLPTTRVLSGRTGTTLFANVPGAAVASVGDYDHDGRADFAVHTYSDLGLWQVGLSVLIVSGRTGVPLHTFYGTWGCDPTYGICTNYRSWLAHGRGEYHFDGDGNRPGPLLHTGVGTMIDGAAFDGRTQAGLGDGDGNGYDDAIVIYGTDLRLIDGRSGLAHSVLVSRRWPELTTRAVRLGDLDRDGVEDYGSVGLQHDTVAPTVGAADVFSGATGTLMKSGGGQLSPVSGMALAAGDVDADMQRETVFSEFGAAAGAVTARKGTAMLWQVQRAVAEWGHQLASGADWNGNGTDDVFVAAADGVDVLDGSNGAQLRHVDTGRAPRLLLLDDLDGDGRSELLTTHILSCKGCESSRRARIRPCCSVATELPGHARAALEAPSYNSAGGPLWSALRRHQPFGLRPPAALSSRDGSVLRTLPGTVEQVALGSDLDSDGIRDLWLYAATNLEAWSPRTGSVLRTLTVPAGATSIDAGADWDGDGVHDLAIGRGTSTTTTEVRSGADGRVLFATARGDRTQAYARSVLLLRSTNPLYDTALTVLAGTGSEAGTAFLDTFRPDDHAARFVPFGATCGDGEQTPRLTWSGPPRTGLSSAAELHHAAPSSNAVLLLGASKQQWGTVALPQHLPFWPGCLLHVSPDVALPAVTNGSGVARLVFANVPAELADQQLYAQAVASPAHQQVTPVTTRGLHLVFGR
ncbi:MAG: hypothetical protein R3F56_09285 [Planctomycetota bacterium]